MMMADILCRFAGHRRARDRVWNDGYTFRTTCCRCGAPLLRDLNGWRRFDTAADAQVGRRAHPRSGG